MGLEALEAAYDLDGAFYDVSLALLPGADPAAVVARLDPMLERYGGRGAVARKDQLSNWFLMNELEQIRTMAVILPSIFLGFAAFLTYTVLARLIATERREISLLKAFGYSNLEVGTHYAKMALAMALVGVALGWTVGAALGRWNTANYAEFFRFPFLYYRPSGLEFLLSAAIGCGVALLGALGAARRAATLPPAEAMRPPAPEMFRHAGVPPALARRLDNPTRMILRQIVRTPGRAAVTVAGVALAVGVLVTAMQWSDSIGYMAKNVFEDSQRQDIVVGFHEVRPDEARFALARLPGVLSVEPLRIVPTKLRAGSRVHRGAITGLAAGGWMQPIRDMRGWILPVPAGGLVLGTALAEKLGVAAGDTVEVETLGGARRRFDSSCRSRRSSRP
jgi:putative ABC transport system permease protein